MYQLKAMLIVTEWLCCCTRLLIFFTYTIWQFIQCFTLTLEVNDSHTVCGLQCMNRWTCKMRPNRTRGGRRRGEEVGCPGTEEAEEEPPRTSPGTQGPRSKSPPRDALVSRGPRPSDKLSNRSSTWPERWRLRRCELYLRLCILLHASVSEFKFILYSCDFASSR